MSGNRTAPGVGSGGSSKHLGETKNTILAEALAQVAKGRVPVPACWEPCVIPWHQKDGPCKGKRPLVKWRDRNTVTAEQVKKWWRRWPLAQLAILTGARSGIIVIDLDGPEGEAQRERLERLYGPLPPTMEVKTTRGRHLYYADPNGKILTRRGGMFWPEGKDQAPAHGFDVRGEIGLVIAPPSVGRVLANDLEPAELPESWAEPLSTSATAAADLDDQELTEALAQIRTDGDPCSCMTRVLEKHATAGGSRHGAMVTAQYALTQLGREQHLGAGQALDQLQEASWPSSRTASTSGPEPWTAPWRRPWPASRSRPVARTWSRTIWAMSTWASSWTTTRPRSGRRPRTSRPSSSRPWRTSCAG